MLGDAILSSSRDVNDIYQRTMAQEDDIVPRLVKSSDSLPLIYQARVRAAVQDLLQKHKPNALTLSKIAIEARIPLAWLLAPYATANERSRLLRSNHTWLAYHDLRSWILFGDPAARLPLAKNQNRPQVTAEAFFGESIVSSKKSSEEVSDKSKQPSERTNAGPPSIRNLPALPCAPSNMLAAVKSFQGARGNTDLEQEISDDFGIELDTLIRWRNHGDELLQWALEQTKVETQN